MGKSVDFVLTALEQCPMTTSELYKYAVSQGSPLSYPSIQQSVKKLRRQGYIVQVEEARTARGLKISRYGLSEVYQ